MKRLFLVGLTLVSAAAAAGAQSPVTKGEVAPKEEIPTEYKPPKGMCRIWLKDVPAKQQPAPTDCAAAVKNVPANGRVIFGDADEKKDKAKGDSLPSTAKGLTGKGQTPVIIKKPPVV
jgi:hypothetical protein